MNMKLAVMAKEAIIMLRVIFDIGKEHKLIYFKCSENKLVLIKYKKIKKCHQIKLVRNWLNVL